MAQRKHFISSIFVMVCFFLIAYFLTTQSNVKGAEYDILADFSYDISDGDSTAKNLWITYGEDGKAKQGLLAKEGIYKNESRIFSSLNGELSSGSTYNYKKLKWSDANDGFSYDGNEIVCVPLLEPDVNSIDNTLSEPWSGNPYFLFKTSTTGYSNIKIDFNLGGSKKGPRDFILQYSYDDVNYITIENTSLSITNNKTMYSFIFPSLPKELDNRSTVYIRLIANSSSTIGGNALTDEPLGGKAAINNVIISGIKTNEVIPTNPPVDYSETIAAFSYTNKLVSDATLDDTLQVDGALTGYSAPYGVNASTSKMFASVDGINTHQLSWNSVTNTYTHEGNNLPTPVLDATETVPWGSTPYFLFEINTLNYNAVDMSFLLGGTKKGPKNYTLEYSLDGKTYTTIPDAIFTIDTNKILTAFNYSLPIEVANKNKVYIKLVTATTDIIDILGGTFLGSIGGEAAINNIIFKEGSSVESKPTTKPNTQPSESPLPNQNVIVNTEPTLTPTSVQSTIAKPKLTSYKKGKKVIKGSTLKKAKVVVKIGSKKYTSTASAKGKFSVKLKKPLKKKQVIKIYASKPGFKKSKTAIYKVK